LSDTLFIEGTTRIAKQGDASIDPLGPGSTSQVELKLRLMGE
jgi:hypothetical protein